MVTRRRFITATFMAWVLFVAIDFMAHASLLSPYWMDEYPAIKALDDLFHLIPFGYLGFLLLTILVGSLYVRIYGAGGSMRKAMSFGISFAICFATASFLLSYSWLELPTIFLFFLSMTYFVELLAVSAIYGYLLHAASIRRRLWLLAAIALLILTISIAIQNVGESGHSVAHSQTSHLHPVGA